MEKHSILINVFGRQFPASVDAEEKVVIEEAARTVNAKIKAFRAQYKTQDDLDIAIMCCLDIMTEYLKDRTQSAQKVETALQQLSRLEQQLDAPVP
ncbi:MAG: cell division protein ZapA [Bacteroidetes bacterium]|nr:MAG: cell division protein ZapA [Bacteroidota bacterium]